MFCLEHQSTYRLSGMYALTPPPLPPPPQSLGAAGLHPSAMDGLASLSALVHLQRLDLSWNMGLRCQQLHAAVTALTKLTALDCSWDR